MSLMVHQRSTGFSREGFCIAPGLIHDLISEQGTSCQGGDGWDMDGAVCAPLPCHAGEALLVLGTCQSLQLLVPGKPTPVLQGRCLP